MRGVKPSESQIKEKQKNIVVAFVNFDAVLKKISSDSLSMNVEIIKQKTVNKATVLFRFT